MKKTGMKRSHKNFCKAQDSLAHKGFCKAKARQVKGVPTRNKSGAEEPALDRNPEPGGVIPNFFPRSLGR